MPVDNDLSTRVGTAAGYAPNGRSRDARPLQEIISGGEGVRRGPYQIVVMTDFGGKSGKTDLANSEVVNNLRSLGRGLVDSVDVQPIDKFSTTQTGFMTAQLALHTGHLNPGEDLQRVFYVNTNPRFNEDGVSWLGGENEGRFVRVVLKNGDIVFTVNTGNNLAFIKEEIAEAHVVNTTGIEQFMSRKPFLVPTMGILRGEEGHLGEELDIDSIPDRPRSVVASIDGTDNIKTSDKKSEVLAQEGIADSPFVKVTINGRTQFAKNCLIEGIHGSYGELVVQAGSSGEEGDRFVEVVRLYGSAAKDFKVKRVTDGMGVKIEPIPGIVFAETREFARV